MQPIASSYLGGLRSHFLSKALWASREFRTFTQSGDKIFRSHSETTARHLHNHAGRTAIKSCHKRDPDEPFSSRQPNFYALSIGRDAQNGCQALIQKKGKLYGSPTSFSTVDVGSETNSNLDKIAARSWLGSASRILL